MDTVGVVAASAQLIGYCYSVTKALLGVFKSINEGPSVYNDQKANIQLLLRIVSQLLEYSIESDNNRDIVLSLIVDISIIAAHTRQLLEEESSPLRKIWNWSGTRPEIVAAFEALSEKRELLQLIVAHNNTEILSNITRYLHIGNLRRPLNCNDKSMGCIASRPTMDSEINANHAKVSNHSAIEIGAIGDDIANLGIQKLVGRIRRRVHAAGATVQDWSKIGIGMPKKEYAKSKDEDVLKEEPAHMPSPSPEAFRDMMDVPELSSTRDVSSAIPELESFSANVNGVYPPRARLRGPNLVFEGYDSP